MQIRRLGYAMGAEISGVDLQAKLSEDTVAGIRSALLEHIVLCFPRQQLDRTQMLAFCKYFGTPDDLSHTSHYDPASNGVTVLANKPLPAPTKRVGDGAGAGWHTDHSYTERPNTMTFLAAQELPDAGGNTMFANMYLAHDNLSPALRDTIGSFSAVHDWACGGSYGRSSPEHRTKMMQINPPVVHPLIRTHPESSRKALYLSAQIRTIEGMSEEESRPILDFLLSHAVRYEFLYRHRWSAHDLVIWDNRCSMHYAVQDYDHTKVRRMFRCSLQGERIGRLFRADGVA